MFAACLTHGEQTNHCKMTMVWWESDVSILLCHCRSKVVTWQSVFIIQGSGGGSLCLLHKAAVSGDVVSIHTGSGVGRLCVVVEDLLEIRVRGI